MAASKAPCRGNWSEWVSKLPIPAEEYLAVHAERRAHLDDLRYLLQLGGECRCRPGILS